MLNALKKHRFLLFTLITFFGIILYELKVDITTLLPNLFANTKSFALIANNDKYVTLDNKTKFIINFDNNIHQFEFLDYKNQMINGKIDINSINNITIIQGNRAIELSKKGFKIGAIGGFSLFHLLTITSGEYYPPASTIAGMLCGVADGVVLSSAGLGIGSQIPNKENYNISKDEWQFIDVGSYIHNN